MACSLTGRLYLDTFRLDIGCTNRPLVCCKYRADMYRHRSTVHCALHIYQRGKYGKTTASWRGYISQPGNFYKQSCYHNCLYHKPCKHLNCVLLYLPQRSYRLHIRSNPRRASILNKIDRPKCSTQQSSSCKIATTTICNHKVCGQRGSTVQDDGDQDIQRQQAHCRSHGWLSQSNVHRY